MLPEPGLRLTDLPGEDATDAEMDAMLTGGARWAVDRGYGDAADLERTEERGCIRGAEPAAVSKHAKRRQRREMGTLGSGNHYLEVQEVSELFDPAIATVFGLAIGDIVVSVHCGSRGLFVRCDECMHRGWKECQS